MECSDHPIQNHHDSANGPNPNGFSVPDPLPNEISNFLRDEDIQKIVAAYNAWQDQERYCRVVDLEEIRKNDYNLNIARYIDAMDEEEQIDVEDAVAELRHLEEERRQVELVMNGYLKELGYGE